MIRARTRALAAKKAWRERTSGCVPMGTALAADGHTQYFYWPGNAANGPE